MSSSSTSSSSGKRKISNDSSLGVPFSVDFIRSQQQGEQQEHPRQKSVRTKDRPSTCVFRYATSNDNSKCLVSVVPGMDLYLSGAARVTFLKGPPLYINGYCLKAGATEHVVISCWMPAGCIRSCLEGETTTKSSSKRQSIKVLLRSYGVAYACDTIEDLDTYFGQSSSILLIESLDTADMEWLEAAENFSERMQHLKHLGGTVDSSLSNFVFLGSVVVGSQAGFAGIGADVQQIASGWEQSVRTLLRGNSQEAKKVVICGAKGVGKSTCLRYTMNRLLSRYGAVAVMDCDVGQPELFLPGFLSLHIVKKPVLSAGHLNITPAEFSYFIGDISTKSNPDLAMTAVRQLFAHYEELRDSYHSKHSEKTKSLGSNMYAVLAQDEDEDEDGINECSLPILVNTDGWVRYMGAEILKNIISVVAPTHLFHVLSARCTDLLDAALVLPAQSELLKLDPGRSSPGKVAATDLRTLR
jgi:energy-coupling factor transporter ATP-binding protein EcfA2